MSIAPGLNRYGPAGNGFYHALYWGLYRVCIMDDYGNLNDQFWPYAYQELYADFYGDS